MENYLAEIARLNKMVGDKKITPEEYNLAIKKIEMKYIGKVHKEDCIVFHSEKDFVNFIDYLKSLNPDNAEDLQWTVEHEREHYRALSNDPELRAQYCFWILKEDNGDISGMPAIFVRSVKGLDHYLNLRKKSLSAVLEKSPLDEIEI
ncbi:MAG: hypothetical protein DRG59_09860 [Deltaproteobacteria bacterium]|nr:MAG: hypothetical protein DRG59_09860 [Deltaproteobacteria bacterium]